ncbi:uncharacterized protein LOC144092637 [Stigmatopora argus]
MTRRQEKTAKIESIKTTKIMTILRHLQNMDIELGGQSILWSMAWLWSEFKRPAATPPFFKMADEPEAGRVGLLSCSELTISRRKTRQTSSRTMQRVRPSTRTDCWETSRMWI